MRTAALLGAGTVVGVVGVWTAIRLLGPLNDLTEKADELYERVMGMKRRRPRP